MAAWIHLDLNRILRHTIRSIFWRDRKHESGVENRTGSTKLQSTVCIFDGVFTRKSYLCPRKFELTYGGILSNAQISGDASGDTCAPRPNGRGGLESAPDRDQGLPRDR